MKILTLEEVAERYHLTPDGFRKRRRALAEVGFPLPLPGFGRLIWSERHLEVWEASTQPAGLRSKLLAEPAAPAGAIDDPEGWDAELRRRLGEMKKGSPEGGEEA